ncbi:uncharacterized protein LOC125452224 isoform X1 [Stegostoma tigrinum]|uniref:uncharacterized protein LOC125452224 isoform X1 n=1 Tax=Stegostoma tigrinum TaxID=3053191 RepID=UPI00286FD541|nr:uncharacterized protein LOC125452224 isoform X1 [Stegostoma tigrinum]
MQYLESYRDFHWSSWRADTWELVNADFGPNLTGTFLGAGNSQMAEAQSSLRAKRLMDLAGHAAVDDFSRLQRLMLSELLSWRILIGFDTAFKDFRLHHSAGISTVEPNLQIAGWIAPSYFWCGLCAVKALTWPSEECRVAPQTAVLDFAETVNAIFSFLPANQVYRTYTRAPFKTQGQQHLQTPPGSCSVEKMHCRNSSKTAPSKAMTTFI